MTRTEIEADPIHLSQATFDRFARYITGELGIKMPESKLTLVQSRLLRRVRELGVGSIERYADYFFASGHDQEREHFINAITTNKTDFFREPQHFEYLVNSALPSFKDLAGGRVKVWSAACSSGEEPYTLAMVLSEYARLHQGFDFTILGTDISTRVLDHARNAIYQESLILPVPAELRRKYLTQSKDRTRELVRVSAELRRRVSFQQLNFMDEHYPVKDTFDVIFCRNVMIYFDKQTQEAVVNRLCRNLVRGGYLFVGHSESLVGFNIPVKHVKTSIYRKPLK